LQDLRPSASTGGAPASSENPSKFHEYLRHPSPAGPARRSMKEFDTHEP
jgi:hypothetical protein